VVVLEAVPALLSAVLSSQALAPNPSLAVRAPRNVNPPKQVLNSKLLLLFSSDEHTPVEDEETKSKSSSSDSSWEGILFCLRSLCRKREATKDESAVCQLPRPRQVGVRAAGSASKESVSLGRSGSTRAAGWSSSVL